MPAIRRGSHARASGSPVISNVSSLNLTDTTAQVRWNVGPGATGQVEYGLTTAYGSLSTLESNFLTFHLQSLSGLTAGQTYHYRVKATNASGSSTGVDFTFTTTSAAIAISSVVVANTYETCAHITWSVSPIAAGQVEYGLTTAYGSATISNPKYWSAHEQQMTGLAMGTLYHYRVKATNASGTTYSADATFTTPAITYTDFTVPSTYGGNAIDGTGVTECSTPINNWVASIASGASATAHNRLIFPGIYKMNLGIHVPPNRAHQTYDGQGTASIRIPAATPGTDLTSAFIVGKTFGGFWDGGTSDIRIKGFDYVGNTSSPGALPGTPGAEYAYQNQQFALINGGNGTEVFNNTMRDMGGDAIYVTFAGLNVHSHSNTAANVGRQGLSVISGQYVYVHHESYGNVGYYMFDMEPNADTESVLDVKAFWCTGIDFYVSGVGGGFAAIGDGSLFNQVRRISIVGCSWTGTATGTSTGTRNSSLETKIGQNEHAPISDLVLRLNTSGTGSYAMSCTGGSPPVGTNLGGFFSVRGASNVNISDNAQKGSGDLVCSADMTGTNTLTGGTFF